MRKLLTPVAVLAAWGCTALADETSLQACIAAPDVACLVAEAMSEMEVLGEEVFEQGGPYIGNVEIWHHEIAILHLYLDDMHGAAQAATGMEPFEMLSFVEERLLPMSPEESDVAPLMLWARRVLEFDFADRESMPGQDPNHDAVVDFFDFKSYAVRLLDDLGHSEEARERFDSVISELEAVLAAGGPDLFVYPFTLVQTANSLEAFVQARHIVDVIVAANPEKDLSNELRLIREAEAAARQRRAFEEDADDAGSASAGARTTAEVWAEQGRIDEVIDYVRSLPEGNAFDQRDVQVMLLVGHLVGLGNLDDAERLAREATQPWMRSDLLGRLARQRAERGDVAAAERLVEELDDPGATTRIFIDLANANLQRGDKISASLLTGSASAALERESNPARLCILGLEIAVLRAELGEHDATRAAIAEAVRHFDVVMTEFPFEYVLEAVSLEMQARVLLGDGDAALEPGWRLVEEEDASADDLDYLLLRAGTALSRRGYKDIVVELVKPILERRIGKEPAPGVDAAEFGYQRIDFLTQAAWTIAGAEVYASE